MVNGNVLSELILVLLWLTIQKVSLYYTSPTLERPLCSSDQARGNSEIQKDLYVCLHIVLKIYFEKIVCAHSLLYKSIKNTFCMWFWRSFIVTKVFFINCLILLAFYANLIKIRKNWAHSYVRKNFPFWMFEFFSLKKNEKMTRYAL